MYLVHVEHCAFSNGDVEGGREELIGRENTENECASIVIAHKPAATGALWSPTSKMCWAEFGNHVGRSSNYRACLFPAGNNF